MANLNDDPRPSSATSPPAPAARLVDVSRWYGEVLGVNKVTVDIYPGITGLVGPNGSGKSTLMNILCGLLRAGQGTVTVLGQPVWDNPPLRRSMGYCAQYDTFYEGATGLQFLVSLLALQGHRLSWARKAALQALERVGMTDDCDRPIRSYSKGMRQRIKIALAIAHEPQVLVLDEPFNGLDPVGRHEMLQLFCEYGREGRTLIISSHILHEIEQMTSRVLMISNGYVIAEGEVHQVRDQMRSHPFHIFIRCDNARQLAALALADDTVTSIQLDDDRALTLVTRDPDRLYLGLNAMITAHDIDVDMVTLADENMQSIYQYLAGREHH